MIVFFPLFLSSDIHLLKYYCNFIMLIYLGDNCLCLVQHNLRNIPTNYNNHILDYS